MADIDAPLGVLAATTRLGVVGGGAASVVFLDALARLGPPGPMVVTVYEPNSLVAVGRPYGPDKDGSLTNRPALEMTTSHADPKAFRTWLEAAIWRGEFPEIKADARFQPRWLFGRYLRDRFYGRVAELAARDVDVRVCPATVQEVTTSGSELVTMTCTGVEHRHDSVVLCVGTPAPTDMYGLAEHSGCVTEPYPLPRAFDPDSSVVVLGCGLTAVDIACALLRRGHRGPVRLVSRRGLLPCVRNAPATVDKVAGRRLAKLVAGTPPEALAEVVVRELRAELLRQGADPDEIAQDLTFDEDQAARLRRQLARIESEDCWRGVLDAMLEPFGELLWQRLPLPDRQEFLTHYDTFASTLLNPMPPATATSLLGWIESGRLEVVRGIRTVRPDSDGRFTVTAGDRTWQADLVFNAVRPTPYHPASPAGSLVAGLETAGLARSHPLGGVHIDFDTNRVLGGSTALFALGHPTSGDIYHANAASLTGMSLRAETIVRELRRPRS